MLDNKRHFLLLQNIICYTNRAETRTANRTAVGWISIQAQFKYW